MGREVRRVPEGFDWPLDEVWGGFLMPDSLHSPECSDCGGRGTTSARSWVAQIAALALLLDVDLRAQEQGRSMHPYLHDTGSRAYGRPSADIREFGTGLAGREASFIGHDAIDNWHATDKLIEAAGLDPKVWGHCPTCEGTGYIEDYPGQSDEAEAWEGTPPPTGEWWQIWETVSEGSPITPAFATAEELATYYSNERGGSYESTLEWITGEAWLPSMILSGGTLRSADQIITGSGS